MVWSLRARASRCTTTRKSKEPREYPSCMIDRGVWPSLAQSSSVRADGAPLPMMVAVAPPSNAVAREPCIDQVAPALRHQEPSLPPSDVRVDGAKPLPSPGALPVALDSSDSQSDCNAQHWWPECLAACFRTHVRLPSSKPRIPADNRLAKVSAGAEMTGVGLTGRASMVRVSTPSVNSESPCILPQGDFWLTENGFTTVT